MWIPMWFSKRAEAKGCGASPGGGKRRGNRPFWMDATDGRKEHHACIPHRLTGKVVSPTPGPPQAHAGCAPVDRMYVRWVKRSGTERGADDWWMDCRPVKPAARASAARPIKPKPARAAIGHSIHAHTEASGHPRGPWGAPWKSAQRERGACPRDSHYKQAAGINRRRRRSRKN